MMSEFKLVYHVLEHLEVGSYFSNVQNKYISDQLKSVSNENLGKDHMFCTESNAKAEATLAELWKIVESKWKEQEEEAISTKRLEGKHSITRLSK